MGYGERHCAQYVAIGGDRTIWLSGARDAAGTWGLESRGQWRRTDRRRRQGHRRKTYASDFRAADLPGWPAATSHAILVRAPDATHVYLGMDLARLNGASKPSVVVTAEDIAKIGTRVPEFYAGDLFCPIGKTPLYMGQPVALLIFEHFDAFDRARLALRDGTFVKSGEETGPVDVDNYAAFRFTRVAGATPDSPDVYSPVQAGWVSPGRIRTPPFRSGRPSPRKPLRPTARPLFMASRSGPNSIRKIRPCWCSSVPSRPSPLTRCFWNRNAGSAGTTGKTKASNSCLGFNRPTRPPS